MARTIFHSFAAPTREIFFLPLEHKFIYPYCCLISSTYGFCYRVILESSSICPIILAQKISSLNVYGQKILSFRGNVQFYEGPQKGSSIPTKLFSQSRNPDGLYRPIPIPIIQFCLIPFPKLRRAFPVGDDFLNQHWSVEIYSHRKARVYLFSPKWWYCSF